MVLVESPHALKNMTVEQLVAQAREMRRFLVREISRTGGHLSSNLGVVELTLALHAVYDSPNDKFIWDVGHQAYVHKILTGRAGRFGTLRQLDGLSGFPKTKESPHDAFDTGHSSTSISVALGLCAARELQDQHHAVVAVIGDGAMTGGMAFEALNNAGRTNHDVLVVLNDNQMSIARNVGAVSRHLNDIRTAPVYREAKANVRRLLGNVPRVGKPVHRWIETAKDALKSLLLPGVLFEELGFQYFGPVDGHDLKTLLPLLKKVRRIKGPVLLHVVTKKGKGYKHAEMSPAAFHGIAPFNPKTGQPVSAATLPSYTEIFGETLTKLAKKDKKIIAITAAMPDGTGLCPFQKQFPARFFDVGIAEGHGVTFAAGMARAGLVPVVAVYSSFLQRAYDQLLHDVCIQNLHVVLAVDRAGLVGADGETHQGLFDLAFLSHMPNMTVMAPKNHAELVDMLSYACLQHQGPVAIRYPRAEISTALDAYHTPIVYGQHETLINSDGNGNTVAIVFVGTMAETALEVAQQLQNRGISVAVYNARFVCPLDETLLEKVAHDQKHRYVFTLEDHVRRGGFGEALLARLAAHPSTNSPTCHAFTFPDQFIEHGGRAQLFARYGLDAASITTKMLEIMNQK